MFTASVIRPVVDEASARTFKGNRRDPGEARHV